MVAALKAPLGIFTLGGCAQCDDAADSRVHVFGNALYNITFAGRVAAFKNHHDLTGNRVQGHAGHDLARGQG